MRDQMMLGERNFLTAVLIIMILVMTFVCLHLFVLKSDAAEIPKIQRIETSVEYLNAFAPAGLETMTRDSGIK